MTLVCHCLQGRANKLLCSAKNGEHNKRHSISTTTHNQQRDSAQRWQTLSGGCRRASHNDWSSSKCQREPRDSAARLAGDEAIEHDGQAADERLGNGPRPRLGHDDVARGHPLRHVAHEALHQHAHAARELPARKPTPDLSAGSGRFPTESAHACWLDALPCVGTADYALRMHNSERLLQEVA